ncbi:C-type lectin domain family 4 member G-like [Pyxicephalus adspersus]|uniref:C-type lectin domain family 4 member G-like n=1 Tax=Pyxicephalus adspersus TaxID=30357 RepID=UPI003B5CD29B
MRRAEEIAMDSGIFQENVYTNSTDFRTQRTDNGQKTKEPQQNPQGWVTITLVVFLILMFVIVLISTSLLFVFYYSIMEEQSSLKNNDKNLTEEVSYFKNDVANMRDDLNNIKKKDVLREAFCTSCRNEWKLIRSKCYYIEENVVKTWTRSRQDCAKRNGILLVLKDMDEMNSLLPVIGQGRFWLGLRRNSSDMEAWLWADGSALTFR